MSYSHHSRASRHHTKSLLARIQDRNPFRAKTVQDPQESVYQPDPLYPPPLPCLAFVRPRRLSGDFLDNSDFSDDFHGSRFSSFFNKLPFTLRQHIMELAFGHRGIYVELDYDHPRFKMRSPGVTVDGLQIGTRRPFSIDNRSCPDPQDSGYSWVRNLARVDKREPKQWQWWSGVCSLQCSVFENPQLYPGHMIDSIDTCKTRGFEWWKDIYGGESMASIGVMGLLLSCRQAYTEGIRVMFSTTRFIMSNPELILNLPRLLVPDHLAWVRSLEMTWKVHPFREQEDDDSVLTDHDTFRTLMQAAPNTFPLLQNLFVSLQGDMYPDPESRVDKEYIFSDEAYNKVEEVALKPMEDMLKRFDWLKVGVIGLPSSCYGPRKQRAMDTGIEVFESRHSMGETFWREVLEIQSKGYWIRLVHRDMGGGDYDRGACGMGFVPLPQEPLDCLYGNSLSPW